MYDVASASFILGMLFFVGYFFTVLPPIDAPYGVFIKVPSGTTVGEAARVLKQKHIINSSLVFEALVRQIGSKHCVIAGEYSFAYPENVVRIALRLATGNFQTKPLRVVLYEGTTAKQMAEILGTQLHEFDEAEFLKIALPQEGYLFPDTYFFLPGAEPHDAYILLHNNFIQHISKPAIQTELKRFDKPLSDIITMASIIEREAPPGKDRRIIAGILWHRIEIGMPLQVDAVFPYIMGKNSSNLTRADLATTSPYNTYIYKGLPPGPIANPGEDAIVAALTPVQSKYIFFLSDKKGVFHYCATYACQLANQKKYLGN